MPLNIKLSTITFTREKNRILCNDAEGHRKQCEDLPPEKKITILQTDADAHNHNKKRESLSPEDNDLFDKKNAVTLKKHRKSFTPNQRDQVLKKDAAEHKINTSCFPQRKKQDSWKPRLNNVMNI